MEDLSVVKKLAVLSLLGGSLVSGAASAATCVTGGSGEASLQEIFDGFTVGPVAGSSSIDTLTDCVPDSLDSIWSITASGGSVATMIIELAGNKNSNTFGVYDTADSSNRVELFNGAAAEGSQVVLSIKLDGSVFVNFGDTSFNFAGNSFGYYLGTANNGTFFSNTSLNGDNMSDHMLAYQGIDVDTIQLADLAAGLWTSNEFVLAWEDVTASKADFDFNDMVLMVESVQPVPVPAAVWLFGSGLLGLVGIARRKAA